MKKSIKNELHLQSMPELNKKLNELKESLSKLSLDKQMGKLKNTSQLRILKAEIAVVQTIIKEKAVEASLIQTNTPEDEIEKSTVKESGEKEISAPAIAKVSAVKKAKAGKKGGKK